MEQGIFFSIVTFSTDWRCSKKRFKSPTEVKNRLPVMDTWMIHSIMYVIHGERANR